MAFILGRKVGMTRVYDKDGDSVPVTVIEAGPCVVVQKKTAAKEGYDAVQLGFGEKQVRAKRNNDGRRRRNSWPGKPVAGHFAKAGTPAFEHLREFRITKPDDFKVGQEVKAGDFKPGERVDVVGVSKGKGFQGVVRRHGFKGGNETHGSMSHRAPGSIGSNADPSRTFPGLRMGGHMGDKKSTIRNVEVVEIDADNNLLMIKGPAPGAKRALVIIQPTNFRGPGGAHSRKAQAEPEKVNPMKAAKKGQG